jgi:hypothetical protein
MLRIAVAWGFFLSADNGISGISLSRALTLLDAAARRFERGLRYQGDQFG